MGGEEEEERCLYQEQMKCFFYHGFFKFFYSIHRFLLGISVFVSKLQGFGGFTKKFAKIPKEKKEEVRQIEE